MAPLLVQDVFSLSCNVAALAKTPAINIEETEAHGWEGLAATQGAGSSFKVSNEIVFALPENQLWVVNSRHLFHGVESGSAHSLQLQNVHGSPQHFCYVRK